MKSYFEPDIFRKKNIGIKTQKQINIKLDFASILIHIYFYQEGDNCGHVVSGA